MIVTQTLGILVITGTTLFTSATTEAGQAWTLATGVTELGSTAYFTTVARATIRVTVVAGYTLLTVITTIAFLTQALAARFVTDTRQGTAYIAITIYERHIHT